MFFRSCLLTISLAEILIWFFPWPSTLAEDFYGWVREYWEMAVPSISCVPSIAKLASEHFSPASHFAPERVDHSLYSDWSVRMARLTYDRLQAGDDPRSIFETLGVNRYKLQEQLKKGEAGKNWPEEVPDKSFGRFRWSDNGEAQGLEWSSEMADLGNICRPLYQIAISGRFVVERVATSKRGGWPQRAGVRQIRYSCLNGKRYNSTEILHFPNQRSCDIIHPSPKIAKRIFTDSIHRLRLLRWRSNKRHVIDLILQSYYAYVQATPFYRGSASIARAFWAGLSSFYLRDVLILPEGFDYLALETSQTDFLRAASRFFGNGCRPRM